MNVMQQPGTNLTYGTMPGAPLSNSKTFFGLHVHLPGKYCEKPKVAGALLNVNTVRAIIWFAGVTIYRTFFNNNSPPLRQFLSKKILLKKNYSYSKELNKFLN